MRFGVRLLQHLGSPRELIELGVLADRAGFDHVWFPSDKFMYHAFPLMVAVAEHTTRIIVGPNGAEPYSMSPGEIATIMATLDHLSGGRTALGFGMHTEEMIEWMGVQVRDRKARVREAVELMRRLWRGENAEFHGEEFNWSDQCYMRFKPLRERIPIYLSGFEEDHLMMTGELGDGSLPMVTPPESASLMVKRVLKGVDGAGRKSGDIDICGCAWFSLSANGAGTVSDSVKDIVAYFGPYLEDQALATIGLSHADFVPIKDRIDAQDYTAARESVTPEMLRLAVVGSPREAIQKIELLADSGITQVSVGGPLGPDPRETIRLFGEQIIPYFRS